jgi:hypothetical protein
MTTLPGRALTSIKARWIADTFRPGTTPRPIDFGAHWIFSNHPEHIMNPSIEPALTLYRTNVEACRELADILVEGTERMEKALFKNVRDGVRQAFGAAGALTSAGPGAAAFKPPQFEEVIGSCREVLEAFTQTGADVARAVTEYCAKYTHDIAEKGVAQVPISGLFASPGQQFEAMLKLWNQTTQQMADLAQHIAQGSSGAGNGAAAAKKSVRAH